MSQFVANCRIPDDCIASKRYPLFMARAVLLMLPPYFRPRPIRNEAPGPLLVPGALRRIAAA